MTTEVEEVKDGILVDDEGNELPQAKSEPVAEEHADDTEDDGDERAAKSSDTNDEEQGHDDETAEEAEARRERNRQRRRENKERRKEAVESLKRELAARDELINTMSERLNAVERRTHSSDLALVDTEMKKTADAYEYFKNQHAAAVQEGNGVAATDATEKMFQAQRRFEQLQRIKASAANQSQAPQPLDPRLKMNAEKWLQQNSWYDPEAKDEDSYIAKQIDNRLTAEGWNPTTEQYWDEFNARIAKFLPHRAKRGYNSNQTGQSRGRSSPVAGSGRDSAGSTSSSQGYRLSAERVSALKDAGIWDDPKQRAEAIKRYKEFDRANARN